MTQQVGCGRLLASLKFVFSFDQISQKETSNRSPSLSLSLLSLSYIYIEREREGPNSALGRFYVSSFSHMRHVRVSIVSTRGHALASTISPLSQKETI